MPGWQKIEIDCLVHKLRYTQKFYITVNIWPKILKILEGCLKCRELFIRYISLILNDILNDLMEEI